MPDFDELVAKGQEVADAAAAKASEVAAAAEPYVGDIAAKAKEGIDTAMNTTPAEALEAAKKGFGAAAEALKNKAEEVTGQDLDGDGLVGKGYEMPEEAADADAAEAAE